MCMHGDESVEHLKQHPVQEHNQTMHAVSVVHTRVHFVPSRKMYQQVVTDISYTAQTVRVKPPPVKFFASESLSFRIGVVTSYQVQLSNVGIIMSLAFSKAAVTQSTPADIGCCVSLLIDGALLIC